MRDISPQAFAALEATAETAFIAKLGEVLRDALPSLANEPEPAFSAQLRLLVEQARGFGLTTEQEIGGYAITAGLLGIDFADQFPGAREILEGFEPPHRKAELLEAFTMNLFEVLESKA